MILKQQNKFRRRGIITSLEVISLLLLLYHTDMYRAPEVFITPELFGIGYYEYVAANGIEGASFEGGCEIVLYGQGMSEMPTMLSAIFQNGMLGNSQAGPPVTQDVAFNSHTEGGKLKYTTSSIMNLHGAPYEAFDGLESVTYDVSLIDYDDRLQTVKTLKCLPDQLNKCKVTYSRAYTPILYSIQPPVLYYGSEIAFWVDPRSAQNKRSPTLPEFPFVEVRLNGFSADFEPFLLEDAVLSTYSKNQITALMGGITPNNTVDVKFRFRVGYAHLPPHYAMRCDYTNTTCYFAKGVAAIYSLSANTGYTTGGQIINVVGFGFNLDDIDIKIDGVPCKLLNNQREKLSCLTQKNDNPSNQTSYVGEHGLRRKLFNQSTEVTWATLQSGTPYREMLAIDLEAPQNIKDGYYGNVYQGYFKAPATANYRFYMACDDLCQLYLSNVTMSPQNKSLILQINSWTNYRQYFTIDGKRMSQWINLTQGEYYYIDVRHIQYSGNDHITVSVEIEDPQITPGHHMTLREFQRLFVLNTIQRELTNITIMNPDGGDFILNYQKPDGTSYASKQMNTNSSAYDFQQAVSGFYSSVWGCWIGVTRNMYDANDTLTYDVKKSVKTVFTLKTMKSIPAPSTIKIGVQKVSTKSLFTIVLPRDLQLSNAPLSGNFKIQCPIVQNPQSDQDWNFTADISVFNSTNQIRDKIIAACPIYREKIEVSDGGTSGYYEDGRDIQIKFVGCNYDVPQFQIMNSDTNPISGNAPDFNSTTWIPYDPTHLFYEPIPFEFLYTEEKTPQMIVSVNGVEAVCDSLKCGYTYVVPEAKITGFSLDQVTSILTITGDSLNYTINSMTFGNEPCTQITKVDASTYTCKAQQVSGNWLPIVIDTMGLIPIDPSVQPLNIPLDITSVSPNTDLNPNGGTVLHIVGSNLPPMIREGTEISLVFDDSTKCNLLTTSDSEMTCMTDMFASGTTSSVLNITINGLVDATRTVTVSAGPAPITSITPTRANPVLKQFFKLDLTGFTEELQISDFEVAFVKQTNSSFILPVNVVEVSNNATEGLYVKVKFGGGESGIYNVQVRSKTYGRFDSSALSVEFVGRVTDFNPKQGSYHGGTLITVNGYEFSNDILDNPIRIGFTDCLLISSSANEIKCRTQPRIQEDEGSDDFLVFLKTYEEAKCDVDPCKFQWIKAGLPKLTTYATAFDPVLAEFTLTLTGENFGALPDGSTQVYIDSQLQEIISANDTDVVVKIINVFNSTIMNIDFFLPIGLPDGMEDLNYNVGITLTPQFLSVSPQVGSPESSLIIAQVKGIGINSANVTLVNSNGDDICDDVNIYNYGVLECKTKKMTIADGALSVKYGSDLFTCLGTNNECNYQTSTSLPSVSSVAMADSGYTIVLTGQGFDQLPGFSPSCYYAGLQSDTCSVISATELHIQYVNGTPVSQTTVAPVVLFKDNSSNITHWIPFAPTATLANPMIAPAVLNEAETNCSFAGGCPISLNQPGLLQHLISDPDNSTIQVCGQVCQPSAEESTSSTVKCYLPPLATTYSIDQYTIIKESYLMGTPFSSNNQLTMTVWDDSYQNGWTSGNYPCYFGTSFRAGYVGVINEVKYFMNRFTKSNYVGKLKFQGSTNGSTWVDLIVIGKEIHEGWNYYNQPSGQEFKYRYFRFYGSAAGSCMVGEISLRGYEVIDNSDPTYTCSASVYLQGKQVSNLTGTINYQGALTPLLKSISPRFGSVVGGEEVTFEGENFSPTTTDYTVLIDGRECAITEASTTMFKCITGKRPGLYENTSLDIKIQGMGSVATQGLLFRYMNYWSEPLTWGGDFNPIDGDMVYIPKGLHLLVDVDSTPKLSAVLVEGSLIFPPNPDPNHLRTFDAQYVLVSGGYFEVGTEDFPYTSKLTITMHGQRSDPELPIFGNKVIAMYDGTLDMHGVKREPTWTEMETTAQMGDHQITLVREVDWKVGERIVIAPTGYHLYEFEEKTIVDIDRTNPSKPILILDSPLEYKHFAGIQYFGSNNEDFIEMRAEVGLLTRNVLFQGDPETSMKNEYGAHIMVHSHGFEKLIGRIEYIELYNCGQEFQLGRYPIHFHLIGAVHNSYIRGNAIHHSYNRAVTIHGVHYLRIINNVAYDVKGHTFFIEDAAETKNVLEGNLVIRTRKSWSLLNSDSTPACFWITHPDNIVRNNHAVAPDNYGYWFDTKPNPTGPSFDPNICPENNPLGEFTNNVAHSTGRYGLRLFHKLIPRLYPCQDLIYDPKNTTDPYWQNPLIPAVFTNFTSWKNARNGFIATEVGGVQIRDFKVADNVLAGLEFEKTFFTADGTTFIDGALVIGYTDNFEDFDQQSNAHGVIGARTEGLQVHNVKFYNFDKGTMAALGSCSHCYLSCSTDSGARTVKWSGLQFDEATVPRRIHWETPYREIFHDLDGSLTGLGANSWATPYWRHNDHPNECTHLPDKYDGLICNPTVQIRRLVFDSYSPDIFLLMDIKLLQIDDDIVGSMDNTTKQSYYDNKDNYSILPFRYKLDPMKAWAIPVVTGHKYKVHWQYGIDFMRMQLTLSQHWNPNDKDVHFVFNFTDVRAQIDFLTGGDNIKNGTILASSNAPKQFGANVVYNDTATREFHLLINGKNATRNPLIMQAYRCIGPCLPAVAQVAIENKTRLWSDPTSWNSSKVPAAGEDVIILPGQNFVFDLQESPIYNYVEINGRITFLQSDNIATNKAQVLHLRAKYIFVRAGELIIGNKTNPFLGKAQITLFGEKQNQQIVYDNAIEAGNKILANTGLLKMYGEPRKARSRLLSTAKFQDTQIQVEAGLDWRVGESLAIAPSNMREFQSDYAVITAYDNATGVVTLDRTLNYEHWGQQTSTGPQYSNIDMRTEVVLLSRNIRIVGNDTEFWGGQVVTSDFIEGNGELRNGHTYLDHVEIYNCSQYDTEKSALRFEGSLLGDSLISNVSIHHGAGYGIDIANAANVTIKDSSVFDFKKFGINIQLESKNITVDNTWVIAVRSRNYSAMSVGDVLAGIAVCAKTEGDQCYDIKILNSMVAGVEFSQVDATGYTVYGHQCGNYDKIVFRNNLAHSIRGYGAIIHRNNSADESSDCMEASYFAAYKCQMAGIVSNQNTSEIRYSHMVFIDNAFSTVPNVGREGESLWAKMKNITYYGETDVLDCVEPNICESLDYMKTENASLYYGCVNKSAIMVPSFQNLTKMPLIYTGSKWPQWKIKADCSWGGNSYFEDLAFINFKSSKSRCGMAQNIFMLNEFNSDYYPPVKLVNTRFDNVDQDAMGYFPTPFDWWAKVDKCGEFPCTAPLNILLSFFKTTYTGLIQPQRTISNFQMISGNHFSSGQFTNCKRVDSWNGYYCDNSNLAVILFENLDDDFNTRMITPITIKNANISSANVLNSFMDHRYVGFYTSLERRSRWPGLIQAGNGYYQEINYAGTPPAKQRFWLKSEEAATFIRIKYTYAKSYVIKDSQGKLVKANDWDSNIQAPALLKGSACGENRFLGVVNILEFYITPGCLIYVDPVDSIQTAIRLNWTISEFYKDGGTTKFVDRMAASLGIKPQHIKVVSVYQGSVIVESQIIDPDQSLASSGTSLEQVQNTLTTKLSAAPGSPGLNLGAPIIGSSVLMNKASVKSTTPTSSNPSTPNTQTDNTQTTTPGSGDITNSNPTVQPKPKPTYNTTVPDPIYTNVTTIIVRTETQQEDESSKITMIAVIVSILGLIVIGSIAGYLIWYKFYRKISTIIVEAAISGANETQKPALDQNQTINKGESPDKLAGEMMEYQPQYQPQLPNIDIFSSNDPFQKINEADDVLKEQENEEDEDEELGGPQHDHVSSAARIESSNSFIKHSPPASQSQIESAAQHSSRAAAPHVVQ